MTARVEEVKADNAPPGVKFEAMIDSAGAPKAVNGSSASATFLPSVSGEGVPSGMSTYPFVYCALPQDESRDDTLNESEAEAANKQVNIGAQDKLFNKDGVTASPLPTRMASTARRLSSKRSRSLMMRTSL